MMISACQCGKSLILSVVSSLERDKRDLKGKRLRVDTTMGRAGREKIFVFKNRRWQTLIVITLLLASFGFFLSFVGRTMQYDEAYTLRHFAVHPGIALLSYTEPNNHKLHSLLVWASTTLAGKSLIAVRFPALACAVLALAMMYRVGRKVGGWQVGLAAAVFLATNGVFADYAVNARGYTLAIFLTLALVEQVFLSKPRPTRRSHYGLMLTACALMLTLPTMALLLAGVIVTLLWLARTPRKYLLLIPPLVIGSMGGALFYLPAVMMGSLARSAGRFGYRELAPLAAEWWSMIFGTPVVGFVLAICFACGVLVLYGQAPFRQTALRQAALAVGGTAVVLLLVQFVLTGQVFYGRNYLYLLPLVCVIAALGTTLLSRRGTVGVAVAVALIAAVPLRATLGAETVFDQLLARFDLMVAENDLVVIGNFADEPLFYSLEQRGQMELLFLSENKARLLVITQAGDDMTTVLNVYGLTPYVAGCQQSEDARWLPFIIYECGFSATPA